jgi:NAD(P)-dependent dehydrogenase (short-subunit alcohol dehydrogenase family)
MSVKTLFDIKGKAALITDSSRGLGLQMADALDEAGARLAITARKPHELEQATDHLKGLGIEALTISYNTSKAAVINFTRALAAEWGKYNINVNATCPGFSPPRCRACFWKGWGRRSSLPRRYNDWEATKI